MTEIYQGECGSEVQWSFTGYTLIISGKGRMRDYEIRSSLGYGLQPFMKDINNDYLVPWKDISEKITKVVVEEGVTYIGAFSFCNCPILEEVSFPQSLSEIGLCAFALCPELIGMNLQSNVLIAEWAFYGSQLISMRLESDGSDVINDEDIEPDPELVKMIREKFGPTLDDVFKGIYKQKDEEYCDKKSYLSINAEGVYGDSYDVDYDARITEKLSPEDERQKLISGKWEGFFYSVEAEEYFQSIYLDSYNKRIDANSEEWQKHDSIDNYDLTLLIRKALVKHQQSKKMIELLGTVTEEDLSDYINKVKQELFSIDLGITGPSRTAIAFTLGGVSEYLEVVLDPLKMLKSLGFDNEEQVYKWLSKGRIDCIDREIVYNDKEAFKNLINAYVDCQRRIIGDTDYPKISLWYLFRRGKLTTHDLIGLDDFYIKDLHIDHQWLISNLSFDLLYKKMCYTERSDNEHYWLDGVEEYLNKEIIVDYPLSSLYVKDELLRGADLYVKLLLNRDGIGDFLRQEILNDERKGEILKYLGLLDNEFSRQADSVLANDSVVDEQNTIIEESSCAREVLEEKLVKSRTPKSSGCWLLSNIPYDEIVWKKTFKKSFQEGLIKRVGAFTFPDKLKARQTKVLVSRISVALFYKAAEKVRLAKPFLSTNGIGVSIENTFEEVVPEFRRQEMGRYMKMLDYFEQMKECKRRNNLNRRMAYNYVDSDNIERIDRKNDKDSGMSEDPTEIVEAYEKEDPVLYSILLENYSLINEILVWLQNKIKPKLPK